MYEILLVVHVLIALMLIGLILIQQGKGAQAGAAFGAGASQTVFGSQGSGGFLSRATGVLAALFFIINLFLAYWVNKSHRSAIPHPVAAVHQQEESHQTPPNAGDVPDVP